LSRAGASVVSRELPERYAALDEAHPIVMQAESAASMGWELLNAPEGISDVLRGQLEWGLAQPETMLDSARSIFAQLQLGFPDVMDGLDILVTPSAPGEAPDGLDFTGNPVFNSYWTPCMCLA